MAHDEEWTEQDDLSVLLDTRAKLGAIEREWKTLRDTSKATTVRLITDWGYSVSKASQLSGHHRNTIMIWLQIHNAEVKAAKKNG